MSRYAPKPIRPGTIIVLLLRGLRYLLAHWPLVIATVFLLSPVGPHLLIWYSAVEYSNGQRVLYDCTYLGSRGIIRPSFPGTCPAVLILDARTGKQT